MCNQNAEWILRDREICRDTYACTEHISYLVTETTVIIERNPALGIQCRYLSPEEESSLYSRVVKKKNLSPIIRFPIEVEALRLEAAQLRQQLRLEEEKIMYTLIGSFEYCNEFMKHLPKPPQGYFWAVCASWPDQEAKHIFLWPIDPGSVINRIKGENNGHTPRS